MQTMIEKKAPSKRDLFRCVVPPGKHGAAEVQCYTVSAAHSQFAAIRGEWIPSGAYSRLEINGRLVMSDTPKEYADHRLFIREAKDHVLIHGLGLGCILNVIQHLPSVHRITVIEINPDVISLVGHYFTDPKIEIIHGDALTWKPPKGTRYGAVWHDIWRSICADNLSEMKRLCRRFGRRADWQGCWAREQIQEGF